MAGFNPYAAGNKVYNGGSSAATSGTVDPMGYIDRELNKPSQTRSGLAAAALARAGLSSGPSGGDAGNTGMGGPVLPPLLQSNPLGQLSLDPDLSAQRTSGLADYQGFQNQLANLLSGLNQQFYSQQRDLGQAQQQDQRNDLNQFSGRGMAFSSGYGQEVVDSANQFQNAFGDLSAQQTNAQNDIENQRLAAATAYSNLLNQLAGEQTQRNRGRAGTLKLNPNYKDPAGLPMPTPSTPLPYGTPATMPKTSTPGAKAPAKKAAAPAKKPTATRQAAASAYRIRQGDTLSAIAARNNTTVQALARLNHISNPNMIRAGSTLRLR